MTNTDLGIQFFEQPHIVNYAQFCFDHLDCDSIVVKEIRDDDLVDVICVAASKTDNDKLHKLFESTYKGKGFAIMCRLSSEDVNSIDALSKQQTDRHHGGRHHRIGHVELGR